MNNSESLTTSWQEIDLGKVATLQRGYDLPSRLRRSGDVPVVTSTGVTDTHSEAKEKAPGVVTGRYGTIGQVFYIEEDYWPHNTTLFIKDFHSNDPLFVSYLLRTIDFNSHSGKSGVPGVNRNDLHELSVRIPSTIAEQRSIATTLSDMDELLGGLDRTIAKKRDLKQATMQQLLTGKTRLPGFNGEWEIKKIGDIAICFSGGTPPTSIAAYYDGDISWITSSDLNRGYIDVVEGRISQLGLANSAAKIIEPNTLLIALYGATSGVTAISRIRAAINQAVLAIVPHQDDTVFLYCKLRFLKDWLISTYTQGGQPNLSGEIVKSIELSMPPLAEQTAIATILSDMDTEISAIEQRRNKTRDLKQAMMQELLTGKIRLNGTTSQ